MKSTMRLVNNTKMCYDMRGWVVENKMTKAIFNKYYLALEFFKFIKSKKYATTLRL